MMLNFIVGVVILETVFLSLSPAFALQCCAQSQAEVNGHISSSASATLPIITNVQEVNLILRLAGHHGHSAPGLTAADFRILDNGQPPERITYFECESNVPLRVALVIDVSDSVAYSYSLERSAAMRFLKNDLRFPDLALVVGFNDQARLLQDSAGDSRLLRKAIREVQKGGQTAIYDAVAFAAQELEKIRGDEFSQGVIIVISDGDDNSSHVSLQDAVQIVQRSQAVVYVLKIGDFAPPEAEDAMKRLSGLTGGKLLGTLDQSAIPFSRIEKDLRNQCAIGYVPADTKPDGTFHRIDVQASKKLKLRYKQGYFAR